MKRHEMTGMKNKILLRLNSFKLYGTFYISLRYKPFISSQRNQLIKCHSVLLKLNIIHYSVVKHVCTCKKFLYIKSKQAL